MAETRGAGTGPLVSVIIVTQDREEMFARALKSVTDQEYRPIEIVAVDNCSKNPLKLPDDIDGVRVKVVRRETMGTSSASRNTGLDHATGEMICFLDDDDYFLPGKIPLQVAFLTAHPDVDYVIGATRVMRNGEEYSIARPRAEIPRMMRRRQIQLNATMTRRRVFDAVRFDDAFSQYIDIDLAVRIYERFNVRAMDDVVSVWNYDGRPDQLTTRKLRRSYENWKRLCEKHSRHIEADPEVTRYYYRRMLALALVFIDIPMALRVSPPLAMRLFGKSSVA